MRCIEAVCDNGQLLVDVFVNYDCDLEGANLFERLILALVRIAQGSTEKEGGAAAAAATEDISLRLTVGLIDPQFSCHCSALSGLQSAP